MEEKTGHGGRTTCSGSFGELRRSVGLLEEGAFEDPVLAHIERSLSWSVSTVSRGATAGMREARCLASGPNTGLPSQDGFVILAV